MYWPVSWTRVYTNTDLSKLNDGAWAAPDPALASLCPALRSAARGTGPNVRAQEPGPGHEDHNYVESKNAGPIWTARAIDNNECTGLLTGPTDHYQVRGNLTFVGKWIDCVWTSGHWSHNILCSIPESGLKIYFCLFISFPPNIFKVHHGQFCPRSISLFLFVSLRHWDCVYCAWFANHNQDISGHDILLKKWY